MEKIYFDNNATTPLDSEVLQAMAKELSGPPSNPSSVHSFGQKARNDLLKARQTVAGFLGARSPQEVIFTSGGTESVNLFLKSIKLSRHVISTAIEHSCVYKTLQLLEKKGLKVTYVPVGLWGAPRLESLEQALRPETQAIVVSAANNETGVQTNLEEITHFAKKKGISLFVDAVAFIGKEPFVLYPGMTAVALSAHKFHGPKGVGALYCNSSFPLEPQFTGGNQEFFQRAGSENLAGILGLAKATEFLKEKQPEITQHIREVRLYFEQEIKSRISDVVIHGEGPRICNTSNVGFLGVDGETLLMQLDMHGIAVGHGSACSSGAIEPSRVLIQMGIDRKTAKSSLRFSFSRFNSLKEVDKVLEVLSELVEKLKK